MKLENRNINNSTFASTILLHNLDFPVQHFEVPVPYPVPY